MLWHYTTGEKMKLIDADGYIKPTTVELPYGERPAVWFSTAPYWEGTASKRLDLSGELPRTATLKEMVELAEGLYRIGIDNSTAPHNWDAFVRLSNASAATVFGLKRAAKEMGASHKHWFVSFEPEGRERWVSVERMDFPVWVPAGQRS